MGRLRVAVVGGGINGVMIAWVLAKSGYQIELFEKSALIGATSAASTKLLHGGLRYLEHGHIELVREGLRERAWWLEAAPHLTRRVELVFPLYRDSPRSRLLIKAGLLLYDALAGTKRLGRHRWLPPIELVRFAPRLKNERLIGGFVFHDGQMDDRALGLWAADQARDCGARIREHTPVEHLSQEGVLTVHGERLLFDCVINAAGPWAKRLLDVSGIASRYDLDLVRGSHLLFNDPSDRGYLLQAFHDNRICFALPYKNSTLVGTTEVRQPLDEPIVCSDYEAGYLLSAYNQYFRESKSPADVKGCFSGLRPLIRSHSDPSRASREYAIERQNRLITVFGGKWTTSRALAQKVCERVSNLRRRPARS
jgi:glycerol-3-phosphate dehydrogenase